MREEDFMTSSETNPTTDDIARIAYAIWEAEGQPEGCDHEHWMRARQLILEDRAEAEYPQAFAEGSAHDSSARPVQPGFEDTPPGMVPKMKAEPGPELQEGKAGRFARQLSELPDENPEKESSEH
jgi:hypothetical protein